jgi:hypothetical protein
MLRYLFFVFSLLPDGSPRTLVPSVTIDNTSARSGTIEDVSDGITQWISMPNSMLMVATCAYS